MKIDLKLPTTTITIITATLQPVYNTRAHTRREKSALSIALDVIALLEKKYTNFKKSPMELFDKGKSVKVSLKHHEADMLELLLLDQIKSVGDPYMKQQVQKVIDMLNQKLA